MIRSLLLCLAFASGLWAQKNLELFLLVGQSNMAGRGVPEAADRQPDPGIFMLKKDLTWAPAVDPMHYDKPEIVGVGLGRSVARTLRKTNPKAEIGLIPAAFGGTSLDQWKPGDALYTDAIRRAKAAMKSGRLRAILWHQGEADSGKSELASTHGKRLTELIASFRKDLDAPDVPFIAGQLGEFYKGEFSSVIHDEDVRLILRVPKFGFVSSAGLVHKGDSVHFDTPSLREFGRRYALTFEILDPSWAAGSR